MEESVEKSEEFENKKLLSSLALVHDCFICLDKDLNLINEANEKIINSFENWINQQRELFNNARNNKNNFINFKEFSISKTIKKNIDEISENFPKQMIIREKIEDKKLNILLDNLINNKKKKLNDFENKDNNITEIKEFQVNTQENNCKEKKIENLSVNENNTNSKKQISLGTIIEQPSREEKEKNDFIKKKSSNNNNNSNSIIVGFIKEFHEEKNDEISQKKIDILITSNNEVKNELNNNLINNINKSQKDGKEESLNQNSDKSSTKKSEQIKIDNNQLIKCSNYIDQPYKTPTFIVEQNQNQNQNQNFIQKNINPFMNLTIPPQNNNKQNNINYFKTDNNMNSKTINIKNIIYNNHNINNNKIIENIGNSNIKYSFKNLLTTTNNNNSIFNSKDSKFINNNEFTISKIPYESSSEFQLQQRNLEPVNNISQFINLTKEKSPLMENNISLNSNNINNNNKNMIFINFLSTNEKKLPKSEKINNHFNEREYSITEKSESDTDYCDEIESFKFIPDWANDKKYIENQIRKQNENENYYKEVFGNFVVEKLNLNMIFETFDDKYSKRNNSTADWRYDYTNKNNTYGVINYQFLNDNNAIFPETNRQLQFSFNK